MCHDSPAPSSGSAAGDTYKRLADVHIRLDSKHEAATAFVESAKAFLKVDHKGMRQGVHDVMCMEW